MSACLCDLFNQISIDFKLYNLFYLYIVKIFWTLNRIATINRYGPSMTLTKVGKIRQRQIPPKKKRNLILPMNNGPAVSLNRTAVSAGELTPYHHFPAQNGKRMDHVICLKIEFASRTFFNRARKSRSSSRVLISVRLAASSRFVFLAESPSAEPRGEP